MANAGGNNLAENLNIDEPLLVIHCSKLSEPRVETISPDLVDYQQVASYNWFGKPDKPVIIVPGAPKKLVKWTCGKLLQDKGELMADENHYMMPSFPMEPLFQAIKMRMDDGDLDLFKFQDFDIATDRNNLRKLFSLIDQANIRQYNRKPYRIDVQRIGNLICLIRCQDQDKEQANNRKTYGQDFEKNSAKAIDDLTNGSYRQIVSYKLGNLKFIVRFEVDCADYDKSKKAPSKPSVTVAAARNPEDAPLHELFQRQLRFSAVNNPERLAGSDLCFIKNGQRYNYHLVELATRIVGRPFPDHVWPQMFFSGTETLVVGWQKHGFVKPTDGVQTYPITDVQERFGGFPRDRMNCFHNLIEKVVTFVREQDENRTFAIYWQQDFGDDIKIVEVIDVDRFAVPDGLKRFIKQN